MLPSETRVLFKCRLEETYVYCIALHASSKESLEELFVGEGKELNELLVTGLIVGLS